jgi:hypothetical protein
MFGSHSAPAPESQLRAIPSGENLCMSATNRFSTSASQAACNGRRSGKPKNSLASAGVQSTSIVIFIAGDVAVLDDLCSDDLIYTHSKADYDDKQSYLHKVGTRYFTYLEITHPADRILVVNGAALVTGRMTAKVLVAGTIVQVDNRYLAVWVREQGARKFVAYQPTPIINR